MLAKVGKWERRGLDPVDARDGLARWRCDEAIFQQEGVANATKVRRDLQGYTRINKLHPSRRMRTRKKGRKRGDRGL